MCKVNDGKTNDEVVNAEMAKCTWVNLTPHAIHFVDENGTELFSVPASGMVARVNLWTEVIGNVNGVPFTRIVYGDVMGLPEPKLGVLYLVSSMILDNVHDRNDIYAPAQLYKDEVTGRIIGARSVSR